MIDEQDKMEKRQRLLYSISEHVKSDPEAASYVADAAAKGLRVAIMQERERAADMEIIASVLLERKFKKRDGLIKSKLNKWKNKCALRWDWYLDGDK